MNTVIVDIKDLIETDTTWVFGTNMFGGREPANPNNTLTIFDTASGRGPFLGLTKGLRYDYAAFQIRVRNHNYDEAMQQANEIVDLLHGVGNRVVNNTLYTVIQALDSPSLLDWDDNNRARIITNFEVQRTPQ